MTFNGQAVDFLPAEPSALSEAHEGTILLSPPPLATQQIFAIAEPTGRDLASVHNQTFTLTQNSPSNYTALYECETLLKILTAWVLTEADYSVSVGWYTGECHPLNCPNNCSGHGLCDSEALCECEAGFFGADCAFQVNIAQTNTTCPFDPVVVEWQWYSSVGDSSGNWIGFYDQVSKDTKLIGGMAQRAYLNSFTETFAPDIGAPTGSNYIAGYKPPGLYYLYFYEDDDYVVKAVVVYDIRPWDECGAAPCDQNPCLNGGVCQASGDCLCPGHYWGRDCARGCAADSIANMTALNGTLSPSVVLDAAQIGGDPVTAGLAYSNNMACTWDILPDLAALPEAQQQIERIAITFDYFQLFGDGDDNIRISVINATTREELVVELETYQDPGDLAITYPDSIDGKDWGVRIQFVSDGRGTQVGFQLKYAVEYPDPATSLSAGTLTAAILVPILGVALITLLVVFLVYRYRHKPDAETEPDYAELFFAPILPALKEGHSLYLARFGRGKSSKHRLEDWTKGLTNRALWPTLPLSLQSFGVDDLTLSQDLVILAHGYDAASDFFRALIQHEVSAVVGVTVLFREETLLTHCYRVYTRLVGAQFLWHIWHRPFGLIVKEQSRSKADGPDNNALRRDAGRLLDAFFSAIDSFPVEIKALMLYSNKLVDARFPAADATGPICSNFIFLRYLSAALMSPQSYGLTRTPLPAGPMTKHFVYLTKILQTLANLSVFEKGSVLFGTNDFIEVYHPKVHAFFTAVLKEMSSGIISPPDPIHIPEDVCAMAAERLYYNALSDVDAFRQNLAHVLGDPSRSSAVSGDFTSLFTDTTSDSKISGAPGRSKKTRKEKRLSRKEGKESDRTASADSRAPGKAKQKVGFSKQVELSVLASNDNTEKKGSMKKKNNNNENNKLAVNREESKRPTKATSTRPSVPTEEKKKEEKKKSRMSRDTDPEETQPRGGKPGPGDYKWSSTETSASSSSSTPAQSSSTTY